MMPTSKHRPLTALELGEVWLVACASLEAASRELLTAHDFGPSEVVAALHRYRRAECSEAIARRSAGSAYMRERAA